MADVKHIKVDATPEEIVKAAFDNNLIKEKPCANMLHRP
jgi:hypothetical protein